METLFLSVSVVRESATGVLRYAGDFLSHLPFLCHFATVVPACPNHLVHLLHFRTMRAAHSFIFVVIFGCLAGFSLSEENVTTSTTTTSTTSTTPVSTTTTSTTTAAPSTTSKPEPPVLVKPFPDNIGDWNVTDTKTNITCIKFKAAIQLTVNYTVSEMKDNKTEETTKAVLVDVPENAITSGKCENASQTLTLTWDNKENKTNEIVLTFTISLDLNKTIGNFTLTKIAVTIQKDNETFPNATSPGTSVQETLEETDLFTAPLNNSYRCEADSEVKQNKSMISVDFQSAQVEAFRTSPSNNTEFSKEYVCTADQVASKSFWMTFFVAIFVVLIIAAAIAALVMFVVRKRRSRVGSGYENM